MPNKLIIDCSLPAADPRKVALVPTTKAEDDQRAADVAVDAVAAAARQAAADARDALAAKLAAGQASTAEVQAALAAVLGAPAVIAQAVSEKPA